MHNDLKIISECANQWIMSFDPYTPTLVQEVIFSRKTKKIIRLC